MFAQLKPYLEGDRDAVRYADVAVTLGWSEVTRRREIAQYVARVEAERASQTRPDDAAAGLRAGYKMNRLRSPFCASGATFSFT